MNMYRGECAVTLTDGSEARLVFNYNVLADLEEQTGLTTEALFERFQQRPLSMLRLLVWAGLQEARPGITVREAGSLIPPADAAFMEAVFRGFAGIMGDADAPPAEPGNAAKPRRARAAAGTSPNTDD